LAYATNWVSSWPVKLQFKFIYKMSFKKLKTGLLGLIFVLSHGHVNGNEIETITVSANRQNTPLIDVAGNVTRLDQEVLGLIEQEHIQQSVVRIPGAWISRGNGQEHLTAIRSPVLTGAGGCGAFFMAEDGISLRAPGFCNANQLFDANSEQAASIEAIRGPSSTLYGTNAVHGVLNILSVDAFNEASNYLALDVGPHNYLRNKFSLATQGEQHAFVAYGNVTSDGGYKDDSGFEQQKINLIHQYQEGKLRTKSMLAVSNLNQQTAGFIQGFEAYKDDDLKQQNPNPEAYRDAKSLRAYSKIEYTPNDDTSFSLMPYVRWNDMQFLQHFFPWQPVEDNAHKSIGLQAQYNKTYQDLHLTSGFDWDYSVGELQETQAEDFSPTLPAGQHYDYRVKASIYSPFAQINWQVMDRTQIIAGLRYEHTDYDYDNKLSNGSACAPEVEGCRFSRPSDQVISYKEWSSKLALNHQFLADHAFYGQLSRGYRAPQVSELFRLQAGQTSADLNAETINSFEMGFRGQWQALFYDLSLFAMNKHNFIFQDSERQNISNGKTTHRGAEFAVKYDFSKNFYLTLAGTLATHKYANELTLSRENILGNFIDTAPKHTGSAQLGWVTDAGHTLELEWVKMASYFLDPENSAEYTGHSVINLRASFLLSERLTLSARLLNLSDEDYAERADFAFGNYRYFVGEPRSLFAGIKYQF
jgi:iron complex outermembrane receptor protein